MKRPEHIAEAKAIGEDSWELQRYTRLPRRASAAKQIEALEGDQKWLKDHIQEVCSRIDRLIQAIEKSEGR